MTPSLRTFNEALLYSCAELGAEEAAVVRAAYDGLLDGKSIPLGTLAAGAGVSMVSLDEMIRHRPGLVRFSADGRVNGCLGLSVEPTRHALEIRDR